MKTIPLTQGQVAVVDDADVEKLSNYTWCAWWNPTSRSFYARTNTRGSRKAVLMHKLILDSGRLQVDHINRDTLDNRRANLRVATAQQNQRNARKHKAGASRFKGVCWHKQNSKWRAYIVVDQRQKSLGLHVDESEAARAYDAAAVRLFGEFACTNASMGLL